MPPAIEMDAGACAVGRIGAAGPWIGFAPAAGGGHRLAVGSGDRVVTVEADADLLLSLAIAYFAEGLDEAPDDLAATHRDVAEVVRRLAAVEPDGARRATLAAAVDAIDDGLGPDVVISRLTAGIAGPAAADPIGHVTARAREILPRS